MTSVVDVYIRLVRERPGTERIITSEFLENSNDWSVKSLEWACSLSPLFNRRGLAV